MLIKERFEYLTKVNNKRKEKKNEKQILKEQQELQEFFFHCPKAKYQFFPEYNYNFAEFMHFDVTPKMPKNYILLGTGKFLKNTICTYTAGTAGDFALILDVDADKLQGNIFRIHNHITCEPIELEHKINSDKDKIGYIVKPSLSANISQAEDDTVFVRARRLASVVEKFTHSDATVDELELLRIIYDNIYYIIIQEIQKQTTNSTEEFKHNVNKLIAEDLKNNLPLNNFINKWENWSDADKTLLAEYDGKTLQEKLLQQQEQERQKVEQQKQKQKELYDYIKLN